MLTDWAKATLPEIFTRRVALDLSLWQMVLIPAVMVIAYVASRLLSSLVTRVAVRLSKLTSSTWDDLLVDRMRGPIRLWFTGVFALLLFPLLDTQGQTLGTLVTLMRMIMLVAGFWALLRAIDIGHQVLRQSPWVHERPATLPVFALLSRVFKIAVFVLGTVTVLQQLGYPVAGILAGLGVGGLAVALAAQKTLENLLGSVMISIDQPLRVGDLVIVDGTTGHVEQIGLRSTQIRTPARTIVTIPNGKLADSKIENLTPRERVQLTFTLGLSYDALKVVTPMMEEITQMLRAHAYTWKDGVFVHLKDITDSALLLEVTTWLVLPENIDLRDERQGVLMDVLKIVTKNGASLAHPTRTLYLNDSRT